VCGACHLIQHLPSERPPSAAAAASADAASSAAADFNFFRLLQLPERFDLSVPALEASFKGLQRSVHPDLFAQKTPVEQSLSAVASSQLNVAYRVLRDPISRAQYLLKLRGIDALGEGRGTGGVSSCKSWRRGSCWRTRRPRRRARRRRRSGGAR
jgi:hypothetical protein